MTKADICNRLRDELDAFEQHEPGEPLVFIDDFDVLEAALDEALAECRGYLESVFQGESVKES